MKDDILESVSQRGSGEETAENRRIYEIADELHRRCQLYEAQLRTSQDDVSHLAVDKTAPVSKRSGNAVLTNEWIIISNKI